MSDTQQEKVLASGIPGLDEVLHGGFHEGKIFVVKGGSGTGKTTFALQYLLAGTSIGERCLYIGMEGAVAGIGAVAASHRWTLDPEYFKFHEMQVPEEMITAQKRRAFHPADLDLGETILGILKAIENGRPKRVVIDTLAELRLLCEDQTEYRRQFLALERALIRGTATVLITDYMGDYGSGLHVEALADGTIELEAVPYAFGPERRRLRVVKYRARGVRSGWHDFAIRTGGIQVYPTLVAGEHGKEVSSLLLSSRNPSLDALLGGGLNWGSVTAVVGPSGSGKSTLVTQFVTATAGAGCKSAVYLFDESDRSFMERGEELGFPLREHVAHGTVSLRQLDVSEISPGEFVHTLVTQVEQEGVSLVVIDSLNGYLDSMADEHFLLVQLHELFTFLNQRGVATILTVVQHGLVGTAVGSWLEMSYLADNLLLLRFFEFRGEVRLALSAIKKRCGRHERTIREISFDRDGIHLSEPLHLMRGVLTGVPDIGEEHVVKPE